MNKGKATITTRPKKVNRSVNTATLQGGNKKVSKVKGGCCLGGRNK